MSVAQNKSGRSLALVTALLTLFALIVPFAGSALAVPVACNQSDVTTVVVITHVTPRPTSSTANITVEARNSAGDACIGVALDYAETADGAGAMTPDTINDQITDSNGRVTFNRTTTANPGTVDWRVWADLVPDNDTLDPGEATVTGTTVVQAPAQNDTNSTLTPATDTNPPSTAHTVTYTVRDQFNTAMAGEDVHFDIAGGNTTAPDCTEGADQVTDGSGEADCTFTNNGTVPTTNTVTACTDATANNSCSGPVEPVQTTATKTFQTSAPTNLDVTPETANNTLPGDTTHTVTATVTNQFTPPTASAGANVDFKIISGPSTQGGGFRDFECTTAGAGTCNQTYTNTAAANGTDDVCGWVDTDGDNIFLITGGQEDGGFCDAETGTVSSDTPADLTDRVQKNWSGAAAAAASLDCSPETASNLATTDHDVTCHVEDANEVNVSGANVNVEASGANDPDGANPSATPDFTCTTAANGDCQFTHDPANNLNGTTTYRAWLAGTTADPNEGQDETALPGNTQEGANGDNTDVVTKTWTGQGATITITPTSDQAAIGTCNPFTVKIVDSAGAPVGNANVDIRQTHNTFGSAGPWGDPGFCPPPAGSGPNISASTESDDGAPDGRSQGQTNGVTDANGQITFGVDMDNAVTGTVTILAWCEDAECVNGVNDASPANNEIQAIATKTWGAGGTDAVESVDAEPETAKNPNGTTHTFTATLKNAGGSPVAGVIPDAKVVSGVNAGLVTITCDTTDNNGVSRCNYADSGSSQSGTDTIEVWVNQSAASGGGTANRDAGEPFDSITKDWFTPPSGLSIDVTCDDSNGPSGDATADDDREPANDQNPFNDPDDVSIDCINPTSEQNETFSAVVTNPNGTGTPNDDTPVAGVQVGWFINADDPNDIGFVPPGGGNDGTVYCTTDATGRCSVVVNNPTPQHGDFAIVTGGIAGQTQPGSFGNSRDSAGKGWARPGEAVSLTLTPQGATNKSGTSHTVTATLTDVFGAPVAGQDVDFQVAGRNTVNGFDKVTDAAGKATLTYNDAGSAVTAGQDTITAWSDTINENDAQQGNEPTDDAVKNWVVNLPTASQLKLDMQLDDDFSTDDCPSSPAQVGDPNTGANGFNDNATAPNGLGTTHEICAVVFDQNNAPIVNGTVTLTITGPGYFTNGAGANQGTSRTVNVDQDGHFRTRISSTTAGQSTVTATQGSLTDSGTKTWQANPPRTIACTPATGTNEFGTEHAVSCLVKDAVGNPVPGWQVFGTTSGAGRIRPTGGIACDPIQTGDPNTCIQVTDSQGVATFILENPNGPAGTQTLKAELAQNANNSVRASSNTTVDECERPVGNPTGAPAGVCTSTVTKTWTAPVVEPECSDGADNDGDGRIDFPADRGCTSATDDLEESPNFAEPCEEAGTGFNVIIGTNGPDVITGTSGPDLICAGAGDDVVSGRGGGDVILLGRGDDLAKGGGGKDNITGGRGNDSISGGKGNDAISGNNGKDTLKGNAGIDTLKGEGGDDSLQGGDGNDILKGGDDNDTLRGGDGDDAIDGGPGRDQCFGNAGNDDVHRCE